MDTNGTGSMDAAVQMLAQDDPELAAWLATSQTQPKTVQPVNEPLRPRRQSRSGAKPRTSFWLRLWLPLRKPLLIMFAVFVVLYLALPNSRQTVIDFFSVFVGS